MVRPRNPLTSSLLVAALVALLGISLAIDLVNLFYKASYHLALMTTFVIVVLITWGGSFPHGLAVIH
jgi:hypothetical protein